MSQVCITPFDLFVFTAEFGFIFALFFISFFIRKEHDDEEDQGSKSDEEEESDDSTSLSSDPDATSSNSPWIKERRKARSVSPRNRERGSPSTEVTLRRKCLQCGEDS